MLPLKKWLKGMLAIGLCAPVFAWICLLGGSRVYVTSEVDPKLMFFFYHQVSEPLQAIGLPSNDAAVMHVELPALWLPYANLVFLVSSAGLILSLILSYFACGIAALVLTLFIWDAPLLAAGVYMAFWVPLEFAAYGVGWMALVSVKLFL